jgi:hypothetical protein
MNTFYGLNKENFSILMIKVMCLNILIYNHINILIYNHINIMNINI